MSQSHPIGETVRHGQDVAQEVDLELVKGLVDGGFEEGFELVDAVLDFGAGVGVGGEGVGGGGRTGGGGGRRRVLREAKGGGRGGEEAVLDGFEGAVDDGVDGVDDVVDEGLGGERGVRKVEGGRRGRGVRGACSESARSGALRWRSWDRPW